MNQIDKMALESYEDAKLMRSRGRIVLADVDHENELAVQSTLRILAEELLVEKTPEELKELIVAIKYLVRRGKEIHFRLYGKY